MLQEKINQLKEIIIGKEQEIADLKAGIIVANRQIRQLEKLQSKVNDVLNEKVEEIDETPAE